MKKQIVKIIAAVAIVALAIGNITFSSNGNNHIASLSLNQLEAKADYFCTESYNGIPIDVWYCYTCIPCQCFCGTWDSGYVKID